MAVAALQHYMMFHGPSNMESTLRSKPTAESGHPFRALLRPEKVCFTQ